MLCDSIYTRFGHTQTQSALMAIKQWSLLVVAGRRHEGVRGDAGNVHFSWAGGHTGEPLCSHFLGGACEISGFRPLHRMHLICY